MEKWKHVESIILKGYEALGMAKTHGTHLENMAQKHTEHVRKSEMPKGWNQPPKGGPDSSSGVFRCHMNP